MSQSLTNMLLSMGGLNETREQYLRVPFSYPGNKYSALDSILPLIPYGEGYGEAFGGSGAILLNRVRSKLEIFNDRYAGVTCLYRVVSDPSLFDRFVDRIGRTVHSREEFIWCKTTWKDCDDVVERAARWYYMIRFAVNAKHNTTFGRSLKPAVPFADRIRNSLPLFGPVHDRLQGVTIENLDWTTCLEDYDQKGFVWVLDPTYLDVWTNTYEHELDERMHEQLCMRIQHLQGYVLLFGLDGPKTRAIYDKFPWKDKIYLPSKGTAAVRAANEGNRHHEKENVGEHYSIREAIWIKEWR